MLFLDLAPGMEAKLIAASHAADMSVSEYVKALFEAATGSETGEPAKTINRDSDSHGSLSAAISAMKENQIRHRELAVQVITQKNNLLAHVNKEERIIAEYERKAAHALHSGNHELAKRFFQEKRSRERLLPMMRANLTAATLVADSIKQNIQQEQEPVRRQSKEAIAIETGTGQAQIAERLRILQNRLGEMADSEVLTTDSEQAFENWVEQMRPEKQETSVQSGANESATNHDAN